MPQKRPYVHTAIGMPARPAAPQNRILPRCGGRLPGTPNRRFRSLKRFLAAVRFLSRSCDGVPVGCADPAAGQTACRCRNSVRRGVVFLSSPPHGRGKCETLFKCFRHLAVDISAESGKNEAASQAVRGRRILYRYTIFSNHGYHCSPDSDPFRNGRKPKRRSLPLDRGLFS